jgi:sortase A
VTQPGQPREVDRRGFLALGALTLIAACTNDSTDAESGTAESTLPAQGPPPSGAPTSSTLPGTGDADTAPLDNPALGAGDTATASASTISSSTIGPPSTLATTLTVPANPRAPEPDVVIGRIKIAALGVDHELREGVTLTTIDKGPGHWPGSALPGQPGNVVVAGHRVTHTKPFRYLNKLSPGDPVTFALSNGATHVYRVTTTEIVDDKAMWITRPTTTPTATLFACHPPGSARQRIVVRLGLDA